MFRTSGPPGENVTLTAATDLTSSPRTSTAGSGPPPRWPCLPPTPPAPSTTGPTQEGLESLSQTTGKRPSSTESPSPAWRSSTTTTETASSGTTWPAPTRSPSSARTWMVTWLTPGSISLRSEYPEDGRVERLTFSQPVNWNLFYYSAIYLFIYLPSFRK